MALAQNFSSVYPLSLFGAVIPRYAALYSLILNFVVCILGTLAHNAASVTNSRDETAEVDYTARAAAPEYSGRAMA